MGEALFSFTSGEGLSSQLDYICDRMDSVLNSMLALDLIKAVIESCSQIGIALMLVYFLVDLLDRVTDVQFNLEVFFKQFIKLIIAFAIMNHLYDLIMGMSQFSTALNDNILATVSRLESGTFWAEAMGSVDTPVASTGSLSLNSISSAKSGATKAVFKIVLQLLTWTLSVERALSIGFQSCLAPISCADIITNGMSSNGIRRLKTILGTFLQTTLILLVTICVNSVCVYNSEAGLISAIIGVMVLWSSVKSSKDLALELFDAG